jgi:hypothetical protein
LRRTSLGEVFASSIRDLAVLGEFNYASDRGKLFALRDVTAAQGGAMAKLLQVDFKFAGPFGREMAGALEELARSINEEPGFVWKIWTENSETREAGGIYVFIDEPTARAYVDKHTERLKTFGITAVNVKLFDINDELTRLTKGPAV